MKLRIAALLGLSAATSLAADAGDANSKVGKLLPFDRRGDHKPVDTPDAALKNLAKAKVPAGFSASIWAAEPMLANPVAFCFDGKGRIFTSETNRYRSSVLDIRHYYWMIEDDLAYRNQADWLAGIKKNFPRDWQDLEKETETIRVLEDSDGDGKADKSGVYAQGFNSPLDGIASGVMWHNDALYFTNIPALWKLTGAEKAQKREELHRGYGVRFSYTGHDFHGLIAGPDGRIYFSIGDRGASIKTKEGATIEVPDEGAVFRCEPDGSHLELVMRGLRNPQELAFDDYGNLFTGDNDSDQGDRERWVAVIEGADAGWRVGYQHHPLGKEFNPWLAEHQWEPRDPKLNQPASILSPIANLPDGPSGLVHYPGTGLPAEYAGSFFLAGYKGSTAKSAVNTFKCEPDGAGFKLTALRTFMDNVQATDVDFGPDSRFYVSAWDEGWERTNQGRIYALSHDAARNEQAAQIAEVQKLLGEGFSKRTPDELVKLLAHADQRVRLRAQWALEEQQMKDHGKVRDLLVPVLMKGADGARKDLSRIHALWAGANPGRLALPGIKDAMQVWPHIGKLLSDEEVKAEAISILSQVRATWKPELTQLVTTKLEDASPRVRFAASMALAAGGTPDTTPAVIQMLRDNADRDEYLRHAGVMALAKCADDAALATAAKDESRSVRLAALLAAARPWTWPVAPANPAPASDAARAALVAGFLHDQDPSIAAEAARLINDAPIPAAMPALAKHPVLANGGASGSAGVPPAGPGDPTGPSNLKERPSQNNAPRASEDRGGDASSGRPQARATPRTSLAGDRMFVVRVLNANFRVGDAACASRLANFAAAENDDALRAAALTMLEKWPAPPPRDWVVGTYRPLPPDESRKTSAVAALASAAEKLLADKSERILNGACAALAANKVTAAAPRLLVLVQDTKAPAKSRIAALDALAKLEVPQFETALAAAGSDAIPSLKTAASKLIGKRNPDTAADQLIAAWTDATPLEKQDIATALGATQSAKAAGFLAKLVAQLGHNKELSTIQPTEAQVEILEAAAKHADANNTPASPQVSELKAALAAREKAIAALPAEQQPMARFHPALAGGDAERGKALFKEHAIAACARCHKLDGVGGDAGPELTGFAAKHDRRYILESIVDVNAKIAPGFQMVLLTMKDGGIKAGLLKSEEGGVITLQNPGMAPEQVKAADVAKREAAPSGMIPNLADQLTPRELRDIVEYMATLK